MLSKASFKLIALALFGLAILPALSGCWTYVNRSAAQKFSALSSNFSVSVYPVNVVKSGITDNDVSLGSFLVFQMSEESLAQARQSDKSFSYNFEWSSNQAAMNQRTAKAFAAQVKTDRIPTDYALLVEVLTNTMEDRFFGVSYYLVDKQGNVADGSLCNSDWQIWKDMNPTNREDAVRLALELMKKNWR